MLRHRLHALLFVSLWILGCGSSASTDASVDAQPPDAQLTGDGGPLPTSYVSDFLVSGDSLYHWSGSTYERMFVRGADLGVGMPGTQPGDLAPQYDDYMRWFAQMKEIGFDVVRIYTLHFPRFHQAVHDYNTAHPNDPIYVIQGIWLSEDNASNAWDSVRTRRRLHAAHRRDHRRGPRERRHRGAARPRLRHLRRRHLALADGVHRRARDPRLRGRGHRHGAPTGHVLRGHGAPLGERQSVERVGGGAAGPRADARMGRVRAADADGVRELDGARPATPPDRTGVDGQGRRLPRPRGRRALRRSAGHLLQLPRLPLLPALHQRAAQLSDLS